MNILLEPPRYEHHHDNAIGIGEASPRISWTVNGDALDWYQEAFELQIRWACGIMELHAEVSSESSLIRWPWRPLKSCESASVRVRARGTGSPLLCAWSQESNVEAGLLKTSDWRCSLVQPQATSSELLRRPLIFSRVFDTPNDITSARLYITSHGIYEATINAKVVGDHVLAPGWTSYGHRLLYQTFDIAALLRSKESNEIGVTVAEGWFCGRLGFQGGRQDVYGESLGLIALIKIAYADGKTQTLGTDGGWRCRLSAIRSSSLYDGENLDCRECKHPPDMVATRCLPVPTGIFAPDGPPVRRLQELKVQQMFRSPSGKIILDFGQNFVGRIRASLDGPIGTKVSFQHAEVLEDGELSIRPLREAKACDSIILSGNGPIEWEPSFAFHGFRYVQVDGWPGTLKPEHVRGVVLHTDMRRTGFFECSNPLVNKLHENVVWSMRGNFVSIPTDCPQRDERLGWTGDINVFAETANYLYETQGMLVSWLKDLAAEQSDCGGVVPLTIPNIIPTLGKEAHAIWGDVSVMLPWSLYLTSGDEEILRRQKPSMVSWLNIIKRRTNGLWHYTSNWKLGDWLDPLAPPQDPGNTTTDPNLVSDAFLIRSLEIMSDISQILGTKDAHIFSSQARRARLAFAHEYITPSGRLSGDTQTAYTLALHFALLDKDQQQRAADRLEELICRNSRFKIATGFAGTPFIGHALTKVGKTNIFYRMLMHRECPSWLYTVCMGGTTMWERWDSMLPNGRVNPGEMTSFNHYALGSIASWLHRVTVGLYPITAGWRTFAVQPVPGGGLRWAQGAFRSAYGICKVLWEMQAKVGENGEEVTIFHLEVIVPLNTTAHIKLPGTSTFEECGSGPHSWHHPYNEELWPPRAMYPPFSEENDDLPPVSVLASPISGSLSKSFRD